MGVSQQRDVPGRSLLQPVELILRLWDNREMVSGEMIRRGFTVNRANIISVQNASFIAAAAYLVGIQWFRNECVCTDLLVWNNLS